uniref:Uncharacterized protein n=1 Tax=Aegilops tauschii subsp. strangulata TaxID=200361 RepID=A0A453R353_AEGTS
RRHGGTRQTNGRRDFFLHREGKATVSLSHLSPSLPLADLNSPKNRDPRETLAPGGFPPPRPPWRLAGELGPPPTPAQ